MDKEQREQFREAVEEKNRKDAAGAQAHEEQLEKPSEQPDSFNPRAKSTGHGKKTADKWNQ
jgi:hypothetical protein